MGRFDSILAQVSDGGRFSSVLDKVDDFGWESVSPILQRRRKPAGGYEYRPNPARGQGGPEAVTPEKKQSFGEMAGNLANRAITASAEGLAALPELLLSRNDYRRPKGQRVTHPDVYGALTPDAAEGTFFDLKAGREDIRRQYEEDKEQFRGANLPPQLTAALDTAAEAIGPAEGLALLRAGSKGLGRGLAKAADPTTGIEAAVRAEFSGAPEAPVPALRTRGAETLARALGQDEIAAPASSGRLQIRDGDFPPDLDPWIRGKGLDPDRMGYREKLDLYAEMNAEERTAHLRDFGKADPAPAPPAELTRERWEEIRTRNAAADEARLRARVPRWSATVPERGAFGRFLEQSEGAIDPADLPFELVDLPLTRFTTDAPSLRKGGEFYELGDSLDYYRRRGNPNQIEGGHSVRQEWFTPRNPLVLLKRVADTPSAETALIRAATEAGHDAVILFRSSERAEVVKTALAGPGRPRRSPYIEAGTRFEDVNAADLAAQDPATDAAVRAALTRGRERWGEGFYGMLEKGDQGLPPLPELPLARGGSLGADLPLVKQGLAKPSEAGALRIGPDPVRADPATEAFRASVFQEQPARPPVAERLRVVKDKLLAEFVSESDPYVARMTKAGAGPEAEVNALELRRAGHTALQPITYATRRWDPTIKDWEYTGEPLEAWTARMDEATQRQVESVLTAESQVEWAGHHVDEADPKRTMESAQYLGTMAPERARLQPHLDAARAYMDRAFLQPLERLGVFSPEQAAEIRAKNQHYSYMVHAEDILGQELRSGEALATKSSPVKRREVGLIEDKKLVPPIEAIAMQAARIDKFQVRQMVRNDLAERVIQSPDLFPELMPAKVGEAGTFVAWKDGKQYAIKAPGDLLDVIDNLQPGQIGPVWAMAKAAKNMMTTLATLAPHFPLANFGFDQPSAAVFSRSEKVFGYVPYASAGKQLFTNIYSWLTKQEPTKAWRDFQASAAGHSTFLRADRQGMSRAVKEARMRATPQGRRALKVREAANPLFVPATVGNALESATRVAEREILLKEGAGAREATSGAARVSLDFSDGGRMNKKWNEVTGFWNVRWLDPARFFREFLGKGTSGKRKMTMTVRGLLWITVPALLEEYFHKDDPGYHNLPWWDQAGFYHLSRSTEGFDEGWGARIPRPQGLVRLVFGILPQLALRQAIKDDPHAVDLAMRSFLDGTPGGLMFSQGEQGGLQPSMEAVPTIARGPAELIANRKWTGAPVVADPRVPVEQQYTDRTSPFVRELAGAMPDAAPDFLQSPQQLEHLVSAQTAGTGRLALDLLNPATRAATGEAEPPREPFSPKDVPIVRNFMSPPPEGFESLPVEDLRRFARRVDGLADLLRKVETSDPARVRILEATYPEIAAHSEVMEAERELALFRQEREDIKASRIPDDLKRARLRQLDKEVTRYAEDWMKEWRKLYPDLLQ